MFKKKENHNITKDYEKTVKNAQQTTNQTTQSVVGGSSNAKQKSSPKIAIPTKKIALIFGAVVLVVILAGFLYISVTNKQLVLVSTTCDSDVVASYNDVSQYKQRGGSEEYTIDEDGLKNLTADIKNMQGYQGDPTCQTILLDEAIYNENYEVALDTYNRLKELHEEHNYVDSNLNAGAPLYAYDILVQQLRPDQGEEQGPQGGA